MALAKSLNAAPEFERQSLVEVLKSVYAGEAEVWSWGNGLIVVEPRVGADQTRRLNIVAFVGSGAIFSKGGLADWLRKKAAAWGCDTIETIAYDPRLARAIESVGGSVESWNMVLKVEG